MNITKNIGFILLSVYLVLIGVTTLAAFTIPPIIMGILALAAGIFIFIQK